MYLLDADTLERVFRGDTSVTERIARTPKDQISVSTLTAEEMLAGTLSEINKAR